MEQPRAPRPWVQIAALCTTALIDNTGALSVIRVTDRIAVAGVTPEMQPQPIQLTLAILMKSDQMRGSYQVKVRCTSPSGNVTPGPEFSFLFEGDDRGVQVVVPFGVLATEIGLYWFDVLVEEDLVTRLPLRVLYQKLQLPPGVQWPGLGSQPGAPGPDPRE